MSSILDQISGGLVAGSFYALIAISAHLTFRNRRYFNFAHGPMILFAVFLTAELARTLTIAGLPAGLSNLLAASIGLVVSASIAVLGENLIARPAMRLRGIPAWVLATFGVGIVLQGMAGLLWGFDPVLFPDVIFRPDAAWLLAGRPVPLRAVAIPGIALGTIILTLFLRQTIWGQAYRATSMNADLAVLQGIPVRRLAIYMSVASAGLAGLAGLLAAQVTVSIGPAFGLRMMFLGFTAALLGGPGSASGAIVGGLLVGMADTLITSSDFPSAGHACLLAVLVLLLTWRPRGLLGRPGPALS
jgi:branched-chain amino acid transport system permease protein